MTPDEVREIVREEIAALVDTMADALVPLMAELCAFTGPTAPMLASVTDLFIPSDDDQETA